MTARRAALPTNALAVRVARDLRHRLDVLTEASDRVRAQRLRPAVAPGGRLGRAHATDAEAIHDLRVAARRLTAGLRLWRPALVRRPRARALRLLRRARRRFGPLRETEVHTTELALRTRTFPKRVPVLLARVAEAWRERYARDRLVALERLTPEQLRSLRLHVEDAIATLSERLRDPRVFARVRRRLADDRSAARAALTIAMAAENAAIEPFHVARIAVKKWRYGEERWHAALGTESRVLDRLRVVQEALGQAHDHATLRHAVSEVLGTAGLAPSPPTTSLLENLAAEERAAITRFRGLVPPLLARVRRPAGGVISRLAG